MSQRPAAGPRRQNCSTLCGGPAAATLAACAAATQGHWQCSLEGVLHTFRDQDGLHPQVRPPRRTSALLQRTTAFAPARAHDHRDALPTIHELDVSPGRQQVAATQAIHLGLATDLRSQVVIHRLLTIFLEKCIDLIIDKLLDTIPSQALHLRAEELQAHRTAADKTSELGLDFRLRPPVAEDFCPSPPLANNKIK